MTVTADIMPQLFLIDTCYPLQASQGERESKLLQKRWDIVLEREICRNKCLSGTFDVLFHFLISGLEVVYCLTDGSSCTYDTIRVSGIFYINRIQSVPTPLDNCRYFLHNLQFYS